MYREKSAFYPCLLGISLAQSKHFCYIWACIYMFLKTQMGVYYSLLCAEFCRAHSKPSHLEALHSFHPEEALAPHSSTLVRKIPWMEEPGRLQSMGLLRVGHNWATPLSLFTFMHWRRKWQPTPVFLPGELQGRRSLVGCHLWGCIESDRTEVT